MPDIVGAIPPELRSDVQAALAFSDAERKADFEVTDIVDPEDAPWRSSAEPSRSWTPEASAAASPGRAAPPRAGSC